MTKKYFTKYTVEQADSSSETAFVKDTEALHKDTDSNKYILSQFAHKDPYVRFTTADLMKTPGNTPLVPYVVQTWNTNTIVTGIPNNNEEKIFDIDATFVKGDASKKCTLQFIFYLPDNYTISSDAQGNVTDVKGTTIRQKDLHGFTVTDNNSKDSHYRVQERDVGAFNVIDIKVYNLKTTEVHNSVSYDRAVIINVKATLGQTTDKKDALGFALWINNEDVSKIDSIPWLIVSEPGTRNISDILITENKYDKSEIDAELVKKVDETDYKVANGITENNWKTKLGIPTYLNNLKDVNLSTLTNGQTLKVVTKADGSKEWINSEDVVYTDQDVKPAKIGTFYFLSTHSNDRELQLPDDSDLVDNDSFYLLATHFNDTTKNYKIKVGSGSTATYNLVKWDYGPYGGGSQQNNRDEYTMRTFDMGIVYRLTYDKTNKGWTMTGVFDWKHLPRTLDSLSDVAISAPNNNEVLRYNSTTKKWENGAAGARGPKGDKGDKGDTGPRGPAGAGGSSGSGFLVSTNVTGGVFAKKADGTYPLFRTGYWRGYPNEGATSSLSNGDTLTLTSASGLTCTVNRMTSGGSNALTGRPFAPSGGYWEADMGGSYYLELEFNKAVTIQGYGFDVVSGEGVVDFMLTTDSGFFDRVNDFKLTYNSTGIKSTGSVVHDQYTSKKFRWEFKLQGSGTNTRIRKFRIKIKHNQSVPANPFPNDDGSTGASIQITSTNSEKYSGAMIDRTKPYIEVDAGSEIFLDKSDTDDKVRTISAGDVEAYILRGTHNINIWKV